MTILFVLTFVYGPLYMVSNQFKVGITTIFNSIWGTNTWKPSVIRGFFILFDIWFLYFSLCYQTWYWFRYFNLIN